MRFQSSLIPWGAVPLLIALHPMIAHAGGSGPLAFTFSALYYEAAEDGTADPTPSQLLALGDRCVIVGHVTEFGPLLAAMVDTVANEYTVVISDGYVSQRQTYLQFLAAYLSGEVRIRVLEQPRGAGTSGAFSPFPPNAGVPANFEDGTVMLGGAVSDFVLTWNGVTLQGNGSGTVRFGEGALLPFLQLMPSTRHVVGFVMMAASSPPGYQLSISGFSEEMGGLPVEAGTWGQLKRRYR